MNRIDLQALTLAGPTGAILVLDPLAVLRLDNQLYIYFLFFYNLSGRVLRLNEKQKTV